MLRYLPKVLRKLSPRLASLQSIAPSVGNRRQSYFGTIHGLTTGRCLTYSRGLMLNQPSRMVSWQFLGFPVLYSMAGIRISGGLSEILRWGKLRLCLISSCGSSAAPEDCRLWWKLKTSVSPVASFFKVFTKPGISPSFPHTLAWKSIARRN